MVSAQTPNEPIGRSNRLNGRTRERGLTRVNILPVSAADRVARETCERSGPTEESPRREAGSENGRAAGFLERYVANVAAAADTAHARALCQTSCYVRPQFAFGGLSGDDRFQIGNPLGIPIPTSISPMRRVLSRIDSPQMGDADQLESPLQVVLGNAL